MVELVPVSRITWEVTESRLTFVEQESEWTGTKICFEISEQGNKSVVKFTHLGLIPAVQCYNECSRGWRQYLDNLLSREITPA
ncbi:SRPBCC domain-containing protein [Mucilaginibacter terrenus]|uniref:SRPBCC domain-containing protein n=1 Tax=Mucilaginibacter terrenus TaxID=2482727 RepID=UPI0021D0E66B|nr:SRPBCC domain-containing protein [Mucilaginibacter terrenus]